jgi:hypothetical protein
MPGVAAHDEKLCAELGVRPVRPARRGSSDPASTPAERSLLRMRQLVEAVYDTLKDRLSLERHMAAAIAQDAAEELDSPVDDLPTSTLAVFDGPTMLGFSAVH